MIANIMLPASVSCSRQLFILRHAKSDWSHDGSDDWLRPLARRGQQAMQSVGAYMQARRYRIDRVFCSTAKRAEQTWQGLQAAWPHAPDSKTVTMMDSLYLASAADTLTHIHHCEESCRNLLIIGHNPGWAELACGLIGKADPETLATLTRKFSTAALAVIGFETPSWQDITPGSGHLLDYQTPRQLLKGYSIL